MPQLKSRSSKTGKSSSSRKSTRAPQRRSGGWWSRIPRQRKIDILGVFLALLGLLSLLSLFSAQRGTLTGAIVDFLGQAAGWGAFVLPVALILIGLWLVFRNIERLPRPNAIRLTGLVLLYLCLLAVFHLAAGGGLALAQKGEGGGYPGAWIEGLLTGGLGKGGAWVVLIAWLLIALALTLDLSVQEIAAFFKPLIAAIRNALQSKAKPQAAPARNIPFQEEPVSAELPADFHPLAVGGARATPAKPAATGRQPAKPEKNPTTVAAAGPAAAPAAPPAGASDWSLPVMDAILDPVTPVAVQANLDHDRGRVIEETLASFGAPGHIVEIHRGPTVTQYGVEPEFVENRSGRMRVRVAKIVSLADDLALALAAPRIRIQAPVPGRNYVGIEVPNSEISRVTLREVMESEPFQKLRSPLRFALGKDVAGKSASYDLTAMPHLLIAGTTGSGKSVCVNAILGTFLMNNTPAELRLVLVDPKRVELTGYNGVPHLLAPVVVDAERVVGALQWMLREMDNRYRKFSEMGVRNIAEFNNKGGERLPYLVVVIDELADLMLLAPEETERSITRLAQLARATGIHLILATQRPSVDVLTGLIKANFPARIAFAVASGVDSRVILDQPGAERLLGRGDMLFQAPDASAPVRLQGVYVAESETQRLVDYWRLAAAQVPSSQPMAGGPVDALPGGVPLKQTPLWDEMSVEEAGDPLYNEALNLVRKEGRASITMLQRRLRIGYTRAARLVDEMEDKGVIGAPVPNSQVREVLDYGPTAPPQDD